jgi:cytoskeletal protein CcmA (bactofilin family)
MSARNFNNTTTVGTLSVGVNAADTSLSVDDFSSNPTAPFTITIGRNTEAEEICLVTSVVGSNLTVTRGYDGTAAQSHSAGATVEHTAIAMDFQDANDHVEATSGVVGTEGAQTLADKNLLSGTHTADVTDGDAIVAVIPPGADVRNLLRGVNSSGVDVIIIDSDGELTTARVHATSTMECDGNLQVDGTLTVASIASGNITSSGDVTISDDLTFDAATGRTATFSEPVSGVTPTSGAHFCTKTYTDAIGTTAATSSTIARRDASGNLTATGLIGSTATVSGTATVNALVATTSITAATGTFSGTLATDKTTINDAPTANDHATRKDYVDGLFDDRTNFRCVAQNVTLSASGTATITHSLGSTPTVVFVQPRENGAVDTHNIAVTAITSTTFSIRAYYDGAVQTGSVSIPIYWIAMVNPT